MSGKPAVIGTSQGPRTIGELRVPVVNDHEMFGAGQYIIFCDWLKLLCEELCKGLRSAAFLREDYANFLHNGKWVNMEDLARRVYRNNSDDDEDTIDQCVVIYMDSELLDVAGSMSRLAPTKAGRPVGPVIIANRLMNYSPRGPDCVRYAILRIRPFHPSREDLVILELVASSVTERDRGKYGFFPRNKSYVREVKSLRFMVQYIRYGRAQSLGVQAGLDFINQDMFIEYS